MAALIWTTGDIAQLVKRYTVDIVNEQSRVSAPLISSKALPVKKKPQVRGSVVVKAGEPIGIGTLADGGTLPAGGNVEPDVLYYDPKIFFGPLKLGRLAVRNVSSKSEGIDLLAEEMRSLMDGLLRQLERQAFASSLGSPTTAVTADTSTTFDVNDWSGFVVGMEVDVHDGSNNFVERVRVTKVAPPADPANDATITFSGDGTGGAAANSWTTSYNLYQRGQQANGMISYADVASSTASLYSKAVTSDDWFGNENTATGELSIKKMRDMSSLTAKRGGKPWDCIYCDQINEQRYGDLLLQNRRYNGSQKADAQGGIKETFEGKTLEVSGNINSRDMFFADKQNVMLHCFYEFGPETNDSDKADVHASHTEYTYNAQVSGAYQMRAQKRSGVGYLAAITG